MDRHDPQLQAVVASAYTTGVNHTVEQFAMVVETGTLPPGVEGQLCADVPCDTATGAMHSLCLLTAIVINEHRIIQGMKADTWAEANPMIARQVSEAMDKADRTGRADTTDGAE